MADLADIFVPNPACPVREVRDGFVVLAANGELTHPLDGLAAFIWRRLDGERDLAAIHADIVAEYDVEPDVAEKDLLSFADALVEAGLVVAG